MPKKKKQSGSLHQPQLNGHASTNGASAPRKRMKFSQIKITSVLDNLKEMRKKRTKKDIQYRRFEMLVRFIYEKRPIQFVYDNCGVSKPAVQADLRECARFLKGGETLDEYWFGADGKKPRRFSYNGEVVNTRKKK